MPGAPAGDGGAFEGVAMSSLSEKGGAS
jgi:hypothetical protein